MIIQLMTFTKTWIRSSFCFAYGYTVTNMVILKMYNAFNNTQIENRIFWDTIYVVIIIKTRTLYIISTLNCRTVFVSVVSIMLTNISLVLHNMHVYFRIKTTWLLCCSKSTKGHLTAHCIKVKCPFILMNLSLK